MHPLRVKLILPVIPLPPLGLATLAAYLSPDDEVRPPGTQGSVRLGIKSNRCDNADPQGLSPFGESSIVGHQSLELITELERGRQMEGVQTA